MTQDGSHDERARVARGMIDMLLGPNAPAALAEERGKVVFANDAFCMLLGIEESPDSLQGWPVEEVIRHARPLFGPSDDRIAERRRIITKGSSWAGRFVDSRGGVSLEIDFLPLPICEEGSAALWLIRESAARREDAAARAELGARYRGFLESQTDLVVRVDPEGRFTYVNDAYCETFGKRREELLGSTFMPLVHEEDLQATLEAMKGLEVPPYRVSVEQRARTAAGWRWISWEDVALHDAAGRMVEIQAVGRDITEIKEAARHAEEVARAAEDASRAKSEFLANISHEIRTPLNGILGLSQLLATHRLDDESREFTEGIHDSARTLLDLIDELLDLSRIEAGQVVIKAEAFSLVALIQRVSRFFRPDAEAKELVIETRIDEAVPAELEGDPGRVRQVLVNLLGNAIKFTDEGGVLIQARPDAREGFVRVEVSDTGVGVPEEFAGRIFEKFTQADGSSTRRYGGAGLGLAISQELVERMGGEIGFRGGESGGSVFHFTLPVEASAHPLEDEDTGPLRGRRPAPANPGSREVLLVEDDRVSQMVMKRLLERFGCRVTMACNGLEALEQVGRRPFDLVLMDCQMPEMDGFDATSAIRENEREGARRLPIVALTANAMRVDRERCLAAGMDSFLAKPILVEALAEELDVWLGADGETKR